MYELAMVKADLAMSLPSEFDELIQKDATAEEEGEFDEEEGEYDGWALWNLASALALVLRWSPRVKVSFGHTSISGTLVIFADILINFKDLDQNCLDFIFNPSLCKHLTWSPAVCQTHLGWAWCSGGPGDGWKKSRDPSGSHVAAQQFVERSQDLASKQCWNLGLNRWQVGLRCLGAMWWRSFLAQMDTSEAEQVLTALQAHFSPMGAAEKMIVRFAQHQDWLTTR